MQDTMTVSEAAAFLGVSRTKLWTLLRDGTLVASRDPLDKRRRLVPAEDVRQLRERGGRPAAPPVMPRTVGMFDDPVTVHSDQIEEYLEAHWRL